MTMVVSEEARSRLGSSTERSGVVAAEDEGGDVGLAKAKNKGRLRMYRSFELVLKNGRILRFEVSDWIHDY